LARREEEEEKARELEASRRIEAMERTKARAAMQATRRAQQKMEESEYVHTQTSSLPMLAEMQIQREAFRRGRGGLLLIG
jgi:hypothetical protein